MRYFSFDFLGFLSLLALIFFRPAFYLRPRALAAPNIRGSAGLPARNKGHTNRFPASGDRSIISATFFNARRRRLIHDRRLMMV